MKQTGELKEAMLSVSNMLLFGTTELLPHQFNHGISHNALKGTPVKGFYRDALVTTR